MKNSVHSDKIVLSQLNHTWIIDIDGTIAKHNGYLLDGEDTLLLGVKGFFDSIPNDDYIILLTSRKVAFREQTVEFLNKSGLRFNQIIFEVPVGERILINDKKPKGLQTAIAVNIDRDSFSVAYNIDKNL